MDEDMKRDARAAIEALDTVLRQGPDVTHGQIQAATNRVVAFRNRTIEKHRTGAATRDTLDRANSLVSLAFGGEFPLSGLHLHRMEQTRDGLRQLLEHRAT